MPRRIEPPAEALEEVCDNEGELCFVNYLREHLPEEWEIYVQPPLNGLRPDVIVLHPRVGVGVFEVKHWNVDLYHNRGDMLYVRSANGEAAPANPCHQVQAYRREMFELIMPSLSDQRAKDRKAHACVKLGIIFTHPSATTAAAQNLLHPHLEPADRDYIAVVGMDTLRQGKTGLGQILPDHHRRASNYFSPQMAVELRHWIAEPTAEAEQREPLELTPKKRHLANTRTRSGFRRIKGPAGSGKSQLLAARAGNLAAEGKRVLLCAYNITMVHYLRDRAVRMPGARADVRRNVRFLWFHQWCKLALIELCGEQEWSEFSRRLGASGNGRNSPVVDRILAEEVPKRLRERADQLSPLPEELVFDAILVDEGQDWQPHWWNTLRKFLRAGGEMLLAADRAQDLYGTAREWTEGSMPDAGFPGGEWVRLNESHRVPPAIVPMLADYLRRYLPTGDAPSAAQQQLPLNKVDLFWVNLPPSASPSARWVQAALKWVNARSQCKDLSYPDCTILESTHVDGQTLTEGLARIGLRTAHVFDENWEVSRGLKLKFRKGMGMLKASTVASFKGWEDRVLIVIVRTFRSEQDKASLYIALSRLKQTRGGAVLFVLSYVPDLTEFGERWFQVVPNEKFDLQGPFDHAAVDHHL
jgi:hypothetical protein